MPKKNSKGFSDADSIISAKDFSNRLLKWFDQHGRHDLPWQHPRTLYRVWISEIMLQQTQVTTVIPYFERFLKRFSNIDELAVASEDEVLHYWSGLGYYARARNLHRAARTIEDNFQGKFPDDIDQVITLPGIGRSTAGAILSQALDQRHPILDGNVKRVLARLHAISEPVNSTIEKQLWKLADQYTPSTRNADYTQAIMDFGATLCTRHNPDCQSCPFRTDCLAFQQNMTDQIPVSKKRKAIPVKETGMLAITNNRGELLLIKRPPSGIWGGLWSLPEFCLDQLDETTIEVNSHIYINTSELNYQSSFTHTFSHFKLHAKIYTAEIDNELNLIMDSSSMLWYKQDEKSAIGIPKPINDYLRCPHE